MSGVGEPDGGTSLSRPGFDWREWWRDDLRLLLLYRQNRDRAASATRASPEQTPMATLAPVDRPLPDVADPPAPAELRRVDDAEADAFEWLVVAGPVLGSACVTVAAPKDSEGNAELIRVGSWLCDAAEPVACGTRTPARVQAAASFKSVAQV